MKNDDMPPPPQVHRSFDVGDFDVATMPPRLTNRDGTLLPHYRSITAKGHAVSIGFAMRRFMRPRRFRRAFSQMPHDRPSAASFLDDMTKKPKSQRRDILKARRPIGARMRGRFEALELHESRCAGAGISHCFIIRDAHSRAYMRQMKRCARDGD